MAASQIKIQRRRGYVHIYASKISEREPTSAIYKMVRWGECGGRRVGGLGTVLCHSVTPLTDALLGLQGGGERAGAKSKQTEET